MPKIILKENSICAGPEGTMRPGIPYRVGDVEAKALVDGGYADYETAMVSPASVQKAGKSPDIAKIKEVEQKKTFDTVVTPVKQPSWGK